MPEKKGKIKIWHLFMLASLVAFLFFSLSPELCDKIYSEKVYPGVRKVLNILFSPFKVSLALFFIGFMLWYIVDSIMRNGFKSLIRIAFILLASFYWLWGFNYYKSPIHNQLGLEFKEVDDSARFNFTNAIMDSCIILSETFEQNIMPNYDEELFHTCRRVYTNIFENDISPTNAVAFKPDAFLLRMGIMGMYFPYTGQGQFDNALTPVDRPFTMAHEWAHAAGIAPEYEADFIAYLICINAEDPQIKYSAYMHLLSELMFYYRIYSRELYDSLQLKMSDNMRTHLDEKRRQFEKYSSVMYNLSDEMIDNYLKFHGQEGLSDYHRLSEYVFAFNTITKE